MEKVDAKALIMGSLFRAPFNDPDVIRDVLRSVKERGMIVFADTKLPNFRQLSLDDISDLLPMIDFITPNLSEAEHYSGRTHVSDMADVFIEKGANNVIIKLGSEGCYFKGRGLQKGREDLSGAADSSIGKTCQISEYRIPAFRTDTVDATGAGDNFIAGFVSEILRGAGIREALKFASACGAVCTTAVGAGTALRNRSQVEDFLKDNSEKAANR
jgi:sugar/nucleoside kinase (ribokinase family)